MFGALLLPRSQVIRDANRNFTVWSSPDRRLPRSAQAVLVPADSVREFLKANGADPCLIPARPTIADIEATASTLHMIRSSDKPFAFVLNQTPIRGQRINNAATALCDEGTLDIAGVLAQPFIVMRNDHQDALSAGLAVSEYAPAGKSADEVRDLWQWVAARLDAGVTADEQPIVGELPASPDILSAMFLKPPAETVAAVS